MIGWRTAASCAPAGTGFEHISTAHPDDVKARQLTCDVGLAQVEFGHIEPERAEIRELPLHSGGPLGRRLRVHGIRHHCAASAAGQAKQPTGMSADTKRRQVQTHSSRLFNRLKIDTASRVSRQLRSLARCRWQIRSFTSAGGLTGIDMRAGFGTASSVPVVDCAQHRDRENDAPDEEPGVP
jgi:hypothetical protein